MRLLVRSCCVVKQRSGTTSMRTATAPVLMLLYELSCTVRAEAVYRALLLIVLAVRVSVVRVRLDTYRAQYALYYAICPHIAPIRETHTVQIEVHEKVRRKSTADMSVIEAYDQYSTVYDSIVQYMAVQYCALLDVSKDLVWHGALHERGQEGLGLLHPLGYTSLLSVLVVLQ